VEYAILLLLAAGFAQHAIEPTSMNRLCQRQIVDLPFRERRRISIVPTPPGGQQHDPRSPLMLLLAVPRRDSGIEPLTISRAKSDFRTCAPGGSIH
jgi:hypothetical protein